MDRDPEGHLSDATPRCQPNAPVERAGSSSRGDPRYAVATTSSSELFGGRSPSALPAK